MPQPNQATDYREDVCPKHKVSLYHIGTANICLKCSYAVWLLERECKSIGHRWCYDSDRNEHVCSRCGMVKQRYYRYNNIIFSYRKYNSYTSILGSVIPFESREGKVLKATQHYADRMRFNNIVFNRILRLLNLKDVSKTAIKIFNDGVKDRKNLIYYDERTKEIIHKKHDELTYSAYFTILYEVNREGLEERIKHVMINNGSIVQLLMNINTQTQIETDTKNNIEEIINLHWKDSLLFIVETAFPKRTKKEIRTDLADELVEAIIILSKSLGSKKAYEVVSRNERWFFKQSSNNNIVIKDPTCYILLRLNVRINIFKCFPRLQGVDNEIFADLWNVINDLYKKYRRKIITDLELLLAMQEYNRIVDDCGLKDEIRRLAYRIPTRTELLYAGVVVKDDCVILPTGKLYRKLLKNSIRTLQKTVNYSNANKNKRIKDNDKNNKILLLQQQQQQQLQQLPLSASSL
jgi:hypothetical protein